MTDAPGRLMAGSPVRLALGVALGLATAMGARAQGMGPGMMGGNGHGMMGGSGPGMMGGPGYGMTDGRRPATGAAPQGPAATPAWGTLTAYVRAHQLTCLSCHALSQRNVGPPFVDIAHRFAGRKDRAAELAHAIGNGSAGQWAGYPPMPGGLATPGQAGTLAQFILDLAR